MNRQEVLLKEYEMCQQDNRHHASTYWLIFGIFMPVNTALLGGIAYSVISNSASLHKSIEWLLLVAVIVSVFGLGMIAILVFLERWLRRINFIIQSNYWRMREIEIHLGMWKSWRIHGIDNWGNRAQISEEDEARLTRYHRAEWWLAWRNAAEYKRPWRYPGWIIYTLIILWGFIIVTAWLLLIMKALICILGNC